MYSLVATLAACCAFVTRGHGEPVYRLPTSVLPTQYKLSLETDPLGYTFSGKVIVDFHVQADTKNITLHSKNLTILSIGLQDDQGINDISSTFTLDPKRDLLLIQSTQPLQSGDHYLLNIAFEGHLNDMGEFEANGYHRVSTGPNKTDWMSSTAFEMVAARETFPCWDEPQFKARFLIVLTHRTTHKALSNMPLIDSVPSEKDGWVEDHFDNSPLMSTYLVTFQLLQWDNIEIKADDGRPLRLWARPKDLPRARDHLDFARQALSWLQNYTGVPEPMPKIDLVAVPKFPGAIENWGDISFGANDLMHTNPKRPRDSEMSTIAHELAHSWFGNLVTPLWWDSLWLSEGAATFFSALAVDELIPGFSHLKKIARSYQSMTYYNNIIDAKDTLCPPYNDMEDLLDMPGNVYYHGFSLFHMLYNILGAEHFKTGVRRYLSALQYDNSTPHKFFRALDYQFDDKDLSELMEEWIYRSGIPLVSVTRSEGQLTLKQERFILEMPGDQNKIKREETNWWIPITFTSQSKKDFEDTRPKLWFKDTETISDPAASTDWIMLNNKASGIYIVKYDKSNLELIKKALSSPDQDNIPEIMREKLFFDYELLMLQGNIELNEVWEMHELLAHEKADGPWKIAITFSKRLGGFLDGTPAGDLLKGQMQRLIKVRMMSEEKEEDGDKDFLQSRVGQSACLFNLAECRRSSHHLFHQWIAQPQPDKVNPIPPELRLVVYCSAMSSTYPEDWDFLLQRAIHAEDTVHRDTMFTGLGCTDNYSLLYKLLESQKETSTMTQRDWAQLLKGLVRHNKDVGSVLRFVQAISQESTTRQRLDSNLLRDLAEQIVEPSYLQQLTDIILRTEHTKSLPVLTRMVEHQIQWRERYKNIMH